jgi:hypothetical protein
MANDDAKHKTSVIVSVEEIDETTPLLGSDAPKPAYVTFPKPVDDETWHPSPGFWWIETGMKGVGQKERDATLSGC